MAQTIKTGYDDLWVSSANYNVNKSNANPNDYTVTQFVIKRPSDNKKFFGVKVTFSNSDSGSMGINSSSAGTAPYVDVKDLSDNLMAAPAMDTGISVVNVASGQGPTMFLVAFPAVSGMKTFRVYGADNSWTPPTNAIYMTFHVAPSTGKGASFTTSDTDVASYMNVAPNTPTTNNPKGTNASPAILTNLTPLLDWSFSDPDTGDTQSKYQLRIKKKSDASIVHDTGLVTSASTDYQVPASVLQANTDYYWEVMTQDAAGLASAYSSAEYFKVVPGAAAGDTYNFAYTGSAQDFVVPGNVTKIKIDAYGGAGGTSGTSPGGKGGYAYGEITVTPGETLKLYVGGKGQDATLSGTFVGGWNGGGTGGGGTDGDAQGPGAGGGGATDLRRGAAALADRLIVAAGGGGGAGGGSGAGVSGGNGGGLTGDNGTSYGNGVAAGTWGKGGTQTAGGAGGTKEAGGGAAGSAGSLGLGGAGAPDASGGGGGGGAGWYGGGGGASYYEGGGGGGSSYYGNSTNAGTTAGVHDGNGVATITIVGITSTTITVTNREPGTNDQLNPEGSNTAPLFTWDYSDQTFVQSKFQLKVFNPDGSVAYDSGLVSSAAKQYQIAAGILTPGQTYGWEITGQNAGGVSVPSNRIYFITNRPPGSLTPISPVDRYRTGFRPTFEATIGDDVENDSQKFVIQIAEDSGFSVGLQERSSENTVSGWEVKTAAGNYSALPAAGVDSSYENGTAKYTWLTDLTEGKTYYWRMAGIDGTTGSRGAYSTARTVRVGNQLDVSLANDIITSAAIQRLLIRAQYALATDGTVPATVQFLATNNALDASPTWEDITEAITSGDYHNFVNAQKTAADWALNIRVIFEANDSLDPIEFYGFGISFD